MSVELAVVVAIVVAAAAWVVASLVRATRRPKSACDGCCHATAGPPVASTSSGLDANHARGDRALS